VRGRVDGEAGEGSYTEGVIRATFALLLALSLTALAAASLPDRVWFSPGPGTIDFIRLFERPEEWAHTRQLFSVFKFYQQHTHVGGSPIVGPNSYEALTRAGVFRTLGQWGKKIALESWAVKEFYCTPDASGMAAAVADTVKAVRAVEASGGTVAYLAMDEPFVSGRDPVCGGPALEPTADRVATYMRGVQGVLPAVKIGWIEAYPFSSAAAIESALGLLTARGVPPAFFHLDVDVRGMRPDRDDFARDVTRLRAVCRDRNIPFGYIIWGYNGDSDTLYSLDADRQAGLLADTLRGDDLPEHLVFQSWAVSSTGLLITPSNLPEDRLYTHTRILWSVLRRLGGQTGPSSGTAVIRR
jgi:hypothetical protein